MGTAGHRVLSGIENDLAAGRLASAETAILNLLRGAPGAAEPLYLLGRLRMAQGRPAEAASAWRQSLAGNPTAAAAGALATALTAMGDHEGCLRACESARDLAPHDPAVRLQLARALRRLGRDGEALAMADEAAALGADRVSAQALRMELLHRLRRPAEAELATLGLLAASPDHVAALELLPRLLRQRGAFVEAAAADARLVAAARGGAVISPIATAFASDDPALLASVARAGIAARLRSPPPPPAAPRQRLTVAYLSPDLRDHPVAHMLADILAAHDRTAFRILTASTWREDDSEMGALIRSRADGHLRLWSLGNAAAAQALRKEKVDVVVDLAGCTNHACPALLHQRPAPVTVMWLGCPVTTGAHWYDAWIVDEDAAPPGYEQHASEPLIRLPCCFHPITTGGASVDAGRRRADEGLPDDAPVVAALHRTDKLSAEMIDAWARICASHPRAVLWLADEHPDRRSALRDLAGRAGLSADRVVFAGFAPDRGRYLARWRLADLALDCFPYGGQSTVAEALARGCPVITRRGRSVPSRVAASMLRMHGLADFVADDRDDFIRLGSRVLLEPALTDTRRRFRAAGERIVADANRTLTRALEGAYRRLHHERGG